MFLLSSFFIHSRPGLYGAFWIFLACEAYGGVPSGLVHIITIALYEDVFFGPGVLFYTFWGCNYRCYYQVYLFWKRRIITILMYIYGLEMTWLWPEFLILGKVWVARVSLDRRGKGYILFSMCFCVSW